MGIGVIIRDCNGDVFATKCTKRTYSCHAFVAECTALWEAMALCEDLGLRGVMFEGDAKCVIDAVKKYEEDDSKFGHLVEGLQQKLKTYNRWEVGFVHRMGNEVAHQLAKMAMFEDDDMYWIEEGPELISNQLLIDKMYTDTRWI
ncbi:uncharacterized protein LOC122276986 [Carya illinoinensis]|uniref:uncharacterized protein LOC122276986 n=1 Tax=Carya illinoinensis TaxID=32201 RepID=UPI001C71E44B|nr:uncharacterized protein LOC122276986 [Carya illinoinensis]